MRDYYTKSRYQLSIYKTKFACFRISTDTEIINKQTFREDERFCIVCKQKIKLTLTINETRKIQTHTTNLCCRPIIGYLKIPDNVDKEDDPLFKLYLEFLK